MGIPLRYNVRNLLRRRLRTALTVLGVALTVSAVLVMLAYSRGLLHSLRNNGDPDNVMVLSRRATDCAGSAIGMGAVEIAIRLFEAGFKVRCHLLRCSEVFGNIVTSGRSLCHSG